VVVEDDVEIGAGACIDRGKCGATRVGRGTKIDNLVQVAHNAVTGPDCILVAQSGLAGSCTLGRGVVVAGQAGVVEHVRLGDGAMVAAQSGVSRHVAAGQTVRGSPAGPLRQALRWEALTRRLPDMAEELRILRHRIEQLESSADHRT
jgi:UDP-3-O-[3-hydroxymyristoyl] glucosamine N-acyltransferase